MKRKNRIALLFLVLLGFCLQVRADGSEMNYVYLGIAGNGPGQGVFGHAFLIFSKNPGDFFESVAYQYNVVSPPDFKPNGFNTYKIQGFLFKLFKEPGFSFISYYTSQNRSVHLFQSKLGPDVVRRIQQDLEKERSERELVQKTDYKLSSNNCLTKAYDALNKYASLNEQLQVVNLAEVSLTFAFDGRDRISESLPLSAPLVLEKSPLFTKEYYFKAIEIKDFEKTLEQVESLRTLLYYCPKDPGVSQLLIRLTSNVKTSGSTSYLGLIAEQFGECVQKNAKAKDAYKGFLDILRLDASVKLSSKIDQTIDELR